MDHDLRARGNHRLAQGVGIKDIDGAILRAQRPQGIARLHRAPDAGDVMSGFDEERNQAPADDA